MECMKMNLSTFLAIILGKKRWLYVIFVLTFFPVPVYSQLANISNLTGVKRSLGIGYLRDTFTTNGIAVTAEQRLTENMKLASISHIWTFPDSHELLLLESFQMIYVGPLGSTGLDFFLVGDMSFEFSTETGYPTRSTYSRRYSRWLLTKAIKVGGGGGILKTIGKVTPFVCLFYQHPVWSRADWDNANFFRPSVGVGFDISRHISLVGRIERWYNQEENGIYWDELHIGINVLW